VSKNVAKETKIVTSLSETNLFSYISFHFMSTPGNDSQSSAVEFTEELVGPFSAFFNQSSGFPFEIDGTQYLSLEHYFQSKKFSGTPHEETIIKAKTTQVRERELHIVCIGPETQGRKIKYGSFCRRRTSTDVLESFRSVRVRLLPI
jgi:hypothetical protein